VIAIAVPPPSLSRRPPGGYVASRTYEEAPLRPLGLRDTHTTTHTHMQVVRLSRRGGVQAQGGLATALPRMAARRGPHVALSSDIQQEGNRNAYGGSQ